MKIEKGKWYGNGLGERYEAKPSDTPSYPWQIGANSYTDEGKCYRGLVSCYDIVREVPPGKEDKAERVTLRDQFAMAALQGCLAHCGYLNEVMGYAHDLYCMADVMLEARKGKAQS